MPRTATACIWGLLDGCKEPGFQPLISRGSSVSAQREISKPTCTRRYQNEVCERPLDVRISGRYLRIRVRFAVLARVRSVTRRVVALPHDTYAAGVRRLTIRLMDERCVSPNANGYALDGAR